MNQIRLGISVQEMIDSREILQLISKSTSRTMIFQKITNRKTDDQSRNLDDFDDKKLIEAVARRFYKKQIDLICNYNLRQLFAFLPWKKAKLFGMDIELRKYIQFLSIMMVSNEKKIELLDLLLEEREGFKYLLEMFEAFEYQMQKITRRALKINYNHFDEKLSTMEFSIYLNSLDQLIDGITYYFYLKEIKSLLINHVFENRAELINQNRHLIDKHTDIYFDQSLDIELLLPTTKLFLNQYKSSLFVFPEQAIKSVKNLLNKTILSLGIIIYAVENQEAHNSSNPQSKIIALHISSPEFLISTMEQSSNFDRLNAITDFTGSLMYYFDYIFNLMQFDNDFNPSFADIVLECLKMHWLDNFEIRENIMDSLIYSDMQYPIEFITRLRVLQHQMISNNQENADVINKINFFLKNYLIESI
jgi:hypothetical protein